MHCECLIPKVDGACFGCELLVSHCLSLHVGFDTDDAFTCRPSLVKGYMQLYSMEQSKSQALEAHAADFSAVKVRLRRFTTHAEQDLRALVQRMLLCSQISNWPPHNCSQLS